MTAKPSDTRAHQPEISADDFAVVKTTLERILVAIEGDEKMGHRGLVTRLNILERFQYISIGAILVIGGDRVIHLFFS